jgi:iron complex outermembrane receptor protein
MKKPNADRVLARSVSKASLTSLSAASLVLGAIASPAVLAQERSSLALEEVIVTARKRAESIQDVPVSVTSLSEELAEASLRRLDDIQSFTPNVYLRTTAGIPGGAAISIRGVSYQETDKSLDPSIGVIMDGLYLGTSSGALLNNFDTQRIEVLRGPQGTLFGKNTTGGVLNIIRGDVTMEWGGDFSVTLGDDGREDFKGVLNVPLIDDKLGVKLFGAQIKSDGWVRNVTVGEDAFGDDKKTYGFAALWRPTDNFDIKLHYEHNKDETDTGANVNVSQAGVGQDLDCLLDGIWPAPSCAATDTRADEDRTTANDRNDNDSEYDTVILTMNWDLGPVLLTSITGNRDMDEDYRFEFDGGAHEFLAFDYTNDWEQFSQELQLTTNFSDKFTAVAGLYYWDVDYEQDWDVYQLLYTLDRTGLLVPGVLPPGAAGFTEDTVSRNGQSQDTTSYAAYAQVDWFLTEKWTLTAGTRYTYEEKDFTGGDGIIYQKVPGEPRPPFPTRDFDDDWDEVTSKLGFQYDFNDDMMVFGSWSEGFKSGGFFGRQANFDIDPTYEPEYVEVWELGMKSTWLDGRMIINPTIFFNDYTDKQEEVLLFISNSNVATIVRNASTLEIFGAELEVIFQVTEGWNLRASYGYLDAEYDDYVADINGDGTDTDNTDLQPRNTPENTFGLNSTYTLPIGPGELVWFASYRWRDDIEVLAFRDPTPGSKGNDPLGHLDSIDNLDMTISYIWGDGRYRLSAYGRNMTDERERVVSRIPNLTSWATWNQGENYGVEFAFSF